MFRSWSHCHLRSGGELGPDPESALVSATPSVPALFCAEMEVEPASKGEDGQEEEGAGPATVKEEGMHLDNGEPPEENEESAGTDSGQELGMEGQNLRSGTYGDRTESKAYGSIIHKCEVRGRGRCQP
jgi:zinc finger/BTB domain-containing protein 17